jgi:GntR family transcriptional regulator
MASSIPLYEQIKSDLQFKIDTGEWRPGDRIPSEKELEGVYNVSRITVRRAVNDLVQSGYLERQRALGTFVKAASDINDKESFTVVKSFTKEMEELGKKPSTISVKVKKVPATPQLARLLDTKVGSDLLYLQRVRGADDQVITYSETYVIFHAGFSLNSADYFGSFYEYLKRFGIHINSQSEYVEAVPSTTELMDFLQIKKPEPLLKRVRRTADYDHQYREYSVNYYIGSRYRYYVRL